MNYQTINFEKQELIATIRLNRPHRLNAVVTELYAEVIDALSDAESDANVRVVVLTGEGRAFCVGADLQEHAAGTRTELQKLEYLQLGNEVCRKVFTHPKIVIAAVNGYAIGAGAEMACSADFILMQQNAEIGFPEVSLGTSVGGGITEILPRLVGLAKARELLIGGHRISGAEAESIGLVSKSYPDDEFEDCVSEFAATVAAKAPFSLKFVKEHLNSLHRDYDSRLKTELAAVQTCMRTEDWQEGIDSFQEKRPPVFKGR